MGRRNAIVENLRVSQISDMIARYTKDIAIDLASAGGVRAFMQDLLYPHDKLVGDEPLPVKGRLLLQELGPTFVKFGQMVGSRRQTLRPNGWKS